MAKDKSGADKPKGNKKKRRAGEVSIKVKKPKSAKTQSGFDALARLAEHPIVADLIAVGATAAVAAIATGMSGKSGTTSTKTVRNAGKAAASAIGQRLMSEFKAVKDSAAEAKSKESKGKAA